MSEKDGGPAFPATGMYAWNEATQQADHLQPSQGMSLRDHFAGQAMQGVLANPGSKGGGDDLVRLLAESSYLIADAMLAESAKGRPVDPAAEAAPDLLAALEALLTESGGTFAVPPSAERAIAARAAIAKARGA